MFDKILIANRGAISCRIQRTLRNMNIASVAVYTEADAESRHVQEADEAVCLGEARASETYLSKEAVIDAAIKTGAQAIHPGYGFLSENIEFARACERAGIVFIGPTPEQIRLFGLKHSARQVAKGSGVPMLPGSGLLKNVRQALSEAKRIGFPVMLKSTAGGGGIGMQCCRTARELDEAFASVQRMGHSHFGDDGLFLEKFVERARHVEVQIFGDGGGRVVALGERDCSPQRRNQKVVEESPAPGLSDATRAAMQTTAVLLGEAVQYRSAGTVEYIYDPDTDAFYFLEMNTRLQVEHGVTEAITGVDLVEWMVRTAAGELDFLREFVYRPRGHAIQVRLYAEDPAKNFQPSSGLITQTEWPRHVRCDTWIESGVEVSPYYDPMLAKLIVQADSRSEALERMRGALKETVIGGIETNLDYLREVVADPVLDRGEQTTAWLNAFDYRGRGIEVLAAGTQTTVQDWPGRLGYWDVGVPPSGPFDELALRLGNRLLGNPDRAAGLEMTLSGATLRFRNPCQVVVCGADMAPMLDGEPVPCWQVIDIPAGGTLTFGAIVAGGCRTYLCFQGGLSVPEYLGSRSTFTLGGFGGHGGRALQTGDVLHVEKPQDAAMAGRVLSASMVPKYGDRYTVRVTHGPHGAPDFLTRGDLETFFETDWEVHYNSSRTGIRLTGPKPRWARSDGGEAGLHPSNIHDNAYAVGSVIFTGDMPIIVGPDGPSLGGFVCPAVIVKADLWKIGQLKAGDQVQFVPIEVEEAERLERRRHEAIRDLVSRPSPPPPVYRLPKVTVLDRLIAGDVPLAVTYRPSGEDNLLIEYGPDKLDLASRFRVQALMERLRAERHPAIRTLTPGIRSLQVHYDNLKMSRGRMCALLREAEHSLPAIDDMEVATRIVHLPLSWNDEQCRLAVEKYMQSVWADAPWCPDNLEFIRRINGLDSIEAVKRIVFDASYLVMGLGDVYLGAP
ncbi:MAG: urea carboxylase, partial [Methylothermaceae bacterium]|nr:urea carboxylase [Methylothermaceae bacterium]